MPNRSEFRPPNPRVSITNKVGVATPLMVKYFNDMGSAFSKLFDRTVTSINGRRGDVELSNADVGLGNVDNTSDRDKPVSTAMNVELGSKDAAGTEKNLLDAHIDEADPHPQYGFEIAAEFAQYNEATLYNGSYTFGKVSTLFNFLTIYTYPVLIGKNGVSFDVIAVDRTGTGGSKNTRIGVYTNKSDTQVYPDTLIYQEELTIPTNGVHAVTLTNNFLNLPSGIYWAAIECEDPMDGSTFRLVCDSSPTKIPILMGYSNSGSSMDISDSITLATASFTDMPTTFPPDTDPNVSYISGNFGWSYWRCDYL